MSAHSEHPSRALCGAVWRACPCAWPHPAAVLAVAPINLPRCALPAVGACRPKRAPRGRRRLPSLKSASRRSSGSGRCASARSGRERQGCAAAVAIATGASAVIDAEEVGGGEGRTLGCVCVASRVMRDQHAIMCRSHVCQTLVHVTSSSSLRSGCGGPDVRAGGSRRGGGRDAGICVG